jgi:ribonuclease HIII
MAKTIVTLELTASQQDTLARTYDAFQSEKKPPHTRFQVRPEGCVITCYNTGKVVFQGPKAESYAAPYLSNTSEKGFFPQAGSDEVGTGDYFGSVCVCAAVVEEKDLPLLEKLGVTDSKALTDEAILSMAPQLMPKLRYSLLVLPPERYNQIHDHFNLNAIKARLHNQAYVNLARRAELPAFCMVDQFTPEKQYYAYLSTAKEVVRGLHFETRAESRYPAVAAASVLARYAFLRDLERMGRQYDMTFVKGAGEEVDACAAAFVDRYGIDELSKVAKVHFKNTERIHRSI